MKTIITAAALGAALLSGAAPALAQTNLSISIGQPGFYGRLDIGDFGRPPVIYAQPVVIERQVHYVGQPIYLRVPPGHAKNWKKHCAQYNACRQQVYFVRDDWYSHTYVPRYQEQHRGFDHHDDRRVEQRVEQRDYQRDDQRDEQHGNGNGKDKHKEHGKGHGNDRD